MRPRNRNRPPPSRVRYEARNPVVSVRVTRALRDQLNEMKEKHGLSMADILRIGLDHTEQVVNRAQRDGYLEALGQCLGEVESCLSCHMRLSELIPDDI